MKNGAPAFVTVALGAIILISIAIGFTLPRDGQRPPRAYPDYNVTGNQSGELQPTTLRPCERMTSREDSDLCAQWISARSAERNLAWNERQVWLGLLTLVGLAVTVLLTFRGAKAAEDTLAHAQLVADAQLRAYVSPGKFKLFDLGTGRYQIIVPLKNSGQTPARNLRTVLRVWLRPYPLTELPALQIPSGPTWLLLGPHSDRQAFVVKKLTAAQVSNIKARRSCLFVRQQITYEIHSGKTSTEPCFNMIAVGSDFPSDTLKVVKDSDFISEEVAAKCLGR